MSYTIAQIKAHAKANGVKCTYRAEFKEFEIDGYFTDDRQEAFNHIDIAAGDVKACVTVLGAVSRMTSSNQSGASYQPDGILLGFHVMRELLENQTPELRKAVESAITIYITQKIEGLK